MTSPSSEQSSASLRMLQYIQEKSSPKYPIFLLRLFFDDYRRASGTSEAKSQEILKDLCEAGFILMERSVEEPLGEPIGFRLSAKGSSYDEFQRVHRATRKPWWLLAVGIALAGLALFLVLR